MTEDEYSIKLAGGNTLEEGIVTFDVVNKGKIPHDLAIEGSGGEDKTPLIDPGKTREARDRGRSRATTGSTARSPVTSSSA